ncbi:ATP-binding protein [Methylopila sp. Yamaguchi]|uniref:ATP-binding protein n=1 Tax=Methylopila sp. Yamaguchi TaxID=1437817 RepID=UPI000CBB5009|nr:ATP-binding protein [Methylopila sp. Yamaguchi]GBD50663.1 integral membrane sensor signal transduction histidine kinase [Methylopila sp. Yamaguchi]
MSEAPATGTFLRRLMPKGLYTRSLLIIVVPMVLLQGVLAFVFLERHYQLVTERLSSAVSQDIAALARLHDLQPTPENDARLTRIARDQLSLQVEFLPPQPLPQERPRPFFSIIDEALSSQLADSLKRPFWIDTVGRSNFVEIRVSLADATMKVLARRNLAYASNSHIFLVWMVGASVVLITVAILFLRNQIRPILALAAAAESFGKGRAGPDFKVRGAREVREAGRAFLDMRDRIERQIEQRTTMLAGVSHDLRTMLTRFRLQLALLDETPEIEDLNRDVDEMSRMLEAYLAFVRGDAGEAPSPTDVPGLLEELKRAAETSGVRVSVESHGPETAVVRPDAFRRCLGNLVSNAARFSTRIAIQAINDGRTLEIRIDDDGPGIPLEKREEVFRPFLRLDQARNQDHGGTGLGLAITRDIARSHGGDVTLESSPLGGLRAVVRVPA